MSRMKIIVTITAFSVCIGLVFLLVSCAKPTATIAPSQAVQASPSASPSPSDTPAVPTPTEEPLAARVNGQGISLADYAAELSRYQAAVNELQQTPEADSGRQVVLDQLVDRLLLAQAAVQSTFQFDEAALKERTDRLAAQLGGEAALQDWQTAHGYTQESFMAALRIEVAAAFERDQLASQIPATAEEIHARQILVTDEATAQKVVDRLYSGTDFATLALKYDPVTGGDLGWFPRGYLPDQAVEAAAFNLQPGQVSPVIQTNIGYHIIQTIERDPQHPLNAEQRTRLQQQAIQKWLEERRASSQIEILIP